MCMYFTLRNSFCLLLPLEFEPSLKQWWNINAHNDNHHATRLSTLRTRLNVVTTILRGHYIRSCHLKFLRKYLCMYINIYIYIATCIYMNTNKEKQMFQLTVRNWQFLLN